MVSLRTSAATGIRYQVVLKISTVLLNQVATIVLARLLLPEDFGIVGIAAIIVGFLAGIADFGLSAALVQGGWEAAPDYQTGATLRFILGLIATVGVLGVAPLLALLYSQPVLFWITWALSPLILLNFLGFVSRVSLTRELRFKQAVTPDIIGRLTSSAVAIMAAFIGLSYWSLVIAPVVGAVVGAIGLYVVRPWNLTLVFDRVVARKLLRFGGAVLASNLLLFVYTNIGVLALATVGLAEVGYFAMAYSWAVAIPLSIHSTLDNAMFPVYATIGQDRERLQRAYLKTLRYLLWFLMPVSILLSAISFQFVSVLLGAAWLPAVAELQLLALAGSLLVFAFSYQSVAVAGGNVRDNLSISATAGLLMVLLGPIAAVTWGGLGLSWAFLAIGVIVTLLVNQKTIQGLKVEPAAMMKIWSPPLVSSAVMYALVFLLAPTLAPSVLSLVSLTGLGALVYVLGMTILVRNQFFETVKEGFSTMLFLRG